MTVAVWALHRWSAADTALCSIQQELRRSAAPRTRTLSCATCRCAPKVRHTTIYDHERRAPEKGASCSVIGHSLAKLYDISHEKVTGLRNNREVSCCWTNYPRSAASDCATTYSTLAEFDLCIVDKMIRKIHRIFGRIIVVYFVLVSRFQMLDSNSMFTFRFARKTCRLQ